MSAEVVFDTNVFVSAYAFGGRPGRLLSAAVGAQFGLVTSPAILAELARVLGLKLGMDPARIEQIVLQLAEVARLVRPTEHIDVVDDESDNRILECAVAGAVRLIVSGDRHLLRMVEYRGIEIVTVTQALERLGIGEESE